MSNFYSFSVPVHVGYRLETAVNEWFPTFKNIAIGIHDHFIPHERNNYHPHILGHRFLGLVSFLLITVKIALIAALSISPAQTTYSSAITTANIISLTNQSRTANGLNPLVQNSKLDRAAQNKANDMLLKGYFAHTSPDGLTPWYWIKQVGYYYLSAGENLAVDFTEAEPLNSAWMNSPGHRANILNKNFEEIGIGIASGIWQGHQTTFVVQMFGAPVAQVVETQPEPTPVAPPVSESKPVEQQNPSIQPSRPGDNAVVPELKQDNLPVLPDALPVTNQSSSNLKIDEVQTELKGSDLHLQVTTLGEAEKVFASYGDKGIRLYPRGQEVWEGSIPLASLPQDSKVQVYVSDMKGQSDIQQVAAMSSGPYATYGDNGQIQGASIDFFGIKIDVKSFEQKFYLLVVAAILVCLILAIAVKKHVQHLSLVANGSFVAILAVLLWVSG